MKAYARPPFRRTVKLASVDITPSAGPAVAVASSPRPIVAVLNCNSVTVESPAPADNSINVPLVCNTMRFDSRIASIARPKLATEPSAKVAVSIASLMSSTSISIVKFERVAEYGTTTLAGCPEEPIITLKLASLVRIPLAGTSALPITRSTSERSSNWKRSRREAMASLLSSETRKRAKRSRRAGTPSDPVRAANLALSKSTRSNASKPTVSAAVTKIVYSGPLFNESLKEASREISPAFSPENARPVSTVPTPLIEEIPSCPPFIKPLRLTPAPAVVKVSRLPSRPATIAELRSTARPSVRLATVRAVLIKDISSLALVCATVSSALTRTLIGSASSPRKTANRASFSNCPSSGRSSVPTKRRVSKPARYETTVIGSPSGR